MLGELVRFNIEILGLQLFYQILAFKKLKRAQIPTTIMTMIDLRVNQIKTYKDAGVNNTALDVLFLTVASICLYSSKVISSLINPDSFIELTSRLLKQEDESAYHKVIINILAVLLSQGMFTEDNRASMKLAMGVTYMDILAVNANKTADMMWRGLVNNPLENINFIEYWREAILKDQHLVDSY